MSGTASPCSLARAPHPARRREICTARNAHEVQAKPVTPIETSTLMSGESVGVGVGAGVGGVVGASDGEGVGSDVGAAVEGEGEGFALSVGIALRVGVGVGIELGDGELGDGVGRLGACVGSEKPKSQGK